MANALIFAMYREQDASHPSHGGMEDTFVFFSSIVLDWISVGLLLTYLDFPPRMIFTQPNSKGLLRTTSKFVRSLFACLFLDVLCCCCNSYFMITYLRLFRRSIVFAPALFCSEFRPEFCPEFCRRKPYKPYGYPDLNPVPWAIPAHFRVQTGLLTHI